MAITVLAINKSQTTGGTVSADVFGSAVSQADNFSFMTDPTWQAAAKSLDLPLLRTNSSILGTIYANGLNNPNWTALNNLVNSLYTWFDGKLIIGLGAPPAGISTTTYGQMVTAIVQRMVAAGVTPDGIETYNEPDGSQISATTVGQYTLAAAKAAQAVNPNIKIFAGVTSWANTSYLKTVLDGLGTTPNVVVDYHAYSSGDTTTPDATLMNTALTYYANSFQSVHNNVSATDPQLIGEYNMSYDWQPTDPRQATPEGAVNAALSMSTAATAGLQMGAIWELYNDQTFGIISGTNGNATIKPAGYTLSELEKVMPGQIVSSSLGSGASNLYTLSTTGGTEIVNYGTTGTQTVNVSGLGSGVTEWIMNSAHPTGATITSPDLSALDISAMSVVILTNGGTTTPSPNDAVVTAGSSGASILDGSGNSWTIKGGVVQENGTAAGYTANVAEIAYVDGSVWQENASNLWWKWSGTAWEGSGATISPLPGSIDTLVLRMSEDAYQGDAQFTVSVDGQQIGGALTASALHSTGDSNVFTLTGNWGQDTRDVKIQFLNDAYGGNALKDRNLYVDSIGYNGSVYASTTDELAWTGSRDFTVGGTIATVSAPSGTLILHLSEDAYQGDAKFTLSIDGKTITTAQPVTASHSAGAWQDFKFSSNFGSGPHQVGVTFTNDAYGGSSSTDRNLYINGVDFNGTHYGNGVTGLLGSGTANFTV